MSHLHGPHGAAKANASIFFSRAELQQLLNLYSTRVARGEWRDYAIDQRNGTAIFSVFRHTLERPIYSICKRGQGSEYVVYAGPQKLKRAGTLADALSVFDKKARLRVVS
jgi:hypothetical protein